MIPNTRDPVSRLPPDEVTLCLFVGPTVGLKIRFVIEGSGVNCCSLLKCISEVRPGRLAR